MARTILLRKIGEADLSKKITELEQSLDKHIHNNTGSQKIPANAISDGTVSGSLQSQNFITGATGSGWKISADGDLEASSGNFRGDITGATGTFSGSLTIGSGNNVVKADGSSGLWVGNSTFGSAPFRVTLAGALTASSATISGDISSSTITSSSFTTAATGQRIVIDTTDTNKIQFLDGSTDIGYIEVAKTDDDGFMRFFSDDGGGLEITYSIGASAVASLKLGSLGGTLFSAGSTTTGNVGFYRTSTSSEYFIINHASLLTYLQTDLKLNSDWIPHAAGKDLGSSSDPANKWSDLYLSDNLDVDGTGNFQGSVTLQATLVAASTSVDIGSSSANFRDIHHSVSAMVDGITAPGTVSGRAQIYVDSADGDLKVKFGDGFVRVIAADS